MFKKKTSPTMTHGRALRKLARACQLEILETRRLFAVVTGSVWNDANGDGIKNTGEGPLAGWTVQLDRDDNGTIDATTTTNASGVYTFSGLSAGTYSVTEIVQDEWVETYPKPTTDFSIKVTFSDNSLTTSQKTLFNAAAARWAEVIVGDLPNVGSIDDLEISASAPSIDGAGGVLGQAGPTGLRNGSFLPYSGIMEFDSADVATMEANGTFFDVILHEMGHVLGLGTIWSNKSLLTGAGGSDPKFTGANAVAHYNQIFGTSATGVPVENSGGSGTRDAHWRESTFRTELMTGFAEPSGTNMELSAITIGQFQDLGYSVNYSAADPYTKPSNSALLASASMTSTSTKDPGHFELYDGPVTMADPNVSIMSGIGLGKHKVTLAANETSASLDFGNRYLGPAVSVTATDATAAENPVNPGTFTFKRAGSTTNPLTIQFTRSGTATSGSDFNAISSSVTFAAGASTASLTLTPIDDLLIEGNETVVLTLSAGIGYQVGSPASAGVTIVDNDGIDRFEGNDSFTYATNLGTLGDRTENDLTIHASFDADYFKFIAAANGTLVATITFSAALGDLDFALFDSAFNQLDTSESVADFETVGATVTAGQTYYLKVYGYNGATNTDYDFSIDAPNPLPVVTLAATDANAGEPNNTGFYTFTRTGSTASALVVNFSRTGSATSGSDFMALPASITIPAGSASATLTLTPINDAIAESSETVILTLASNSAYSVGSPGAATVTITDDDPATLALAPAADSFVRNGTNGNTNYGSLTQLEVKHDGLGNLRETYLKFSLSNVNSVGQAVLKLYGKLSDAVATGIPVSIFATNGAVWSETSLTFNNKPAITGSALASATILGTTQTTYSFDLTSYVQAQKALGKTEITLVLKASAGGALVTFNSRTAASNKPELNVTPAPQGIVVSKSALNVNEGSTNTFTVKLAAQPSANVVVSIARSGDTSLTSSASTLTFTPSNWNTAQTITLSAAQDADTTNGSATFSLSSSGLTTKSVIATEVDDDAAAILGASADAYVRDGSQAGANFGAATVLEVKQDGVGAYRQAYLTFNLSSVSSFTSAKLRLFGKISDPVTNGINVAVYEVPNTAWSESTLTYANRPPHSPSILASANVGSTAYNWIEWDLTQFLQAQRDAGKTVVTLSLKASQSGALVNFASKESPNAGGLLIS